MTQRAWSQIFRSTEFLAKAHREGCSCVLVCKDEEWLRDGNGPTDEGVYAILYVLDPSEALLYDDGVYNEYSNLLLRCLRPHQYNPRRGEVEFLDKRIKLNIWQHEIKTRVVEPSIVNGHKIDVVKIIKGDIGAVLDDMEKIFGIKYGRFSTYALFWRGQEIIECSKDIDDVNHSACLLFHNLRTSKRDELLICKRPYRHIERNTTVWVEGGRPKEADYKLLEDLIWNIKDHPDNARFLCHGYHPEDAQLSCGEKCTGSRAMTVLDTFDLVFPETIKIRVPDYKGKKTHGIYIQGTLTNALVTLYSFFKENKMAWEEAQGYPSSNVGDERKWKGIKYDIDRDAWVCELSYQPIKLISRIKT
jgi:hypothetical protein